MADLPWHGDACSLVEAFRAGTHSPVDELEATLAAIEARATSTPSPTSMPTGPGRPRPRPTSPCPSVGCRRPSRSSSRWPAGPGPRGRSCSRTASPPGPPTTSSRLFEQGGVVPVGKTTASEFGGLNVSVTKINGVTHNPWRHGRTVGGSSSGSAAAVSGGLVSLATGGDGGGSIRIPAGYTGLLGMKGTFGRITRGPARVHAPEHRRAGHPGPVRARRRPPLRRRRRAWTRTTAPPCPRRAAGRPASAATTCGAARWRSCPALGGVTLEPGVEARLREDAAALIAETGMVQVDLAVNPPNLAAQWMMGNLATLLADLGDKLAQVRRRPHRRGGHGPAHGRVALQPPHRGGGRGDAHRGQRGDGPRPSSRSTSSSPPPTPAPPSRPRPPRAAATRASSTGPCQNSHRQGRLPGPARRACGW